MPFFTVSSPSERHDKKFNWIGKSSGFIGNQKPVCDICRITMIYMSDREKWICQNCGQMLEQVVWLDRQRKLIQKQARELANSIKFDDGTMIGQGNREVVMQKHMEHEDSRKKIRRRVSNVDKELRDMGFTITQSDEVVIR